MPPIVAAAAITGLASAGTAVVGARAQSGARRRAIDAQNQAAQRAESFEREQDALNRADDARRDAEDRRRWEVEQENVRARQAEIDSRQQYDDMLRYRKMVNLAQLTGQPVPPPPPFLRGGAQPGAPQGAPQGMPLRQLSRPPVAMASAPSRTNALIQSNTDPLFDPLAEQRMPLSRLSGGMR